MIDENVIKKSLQNLYDLINDYHEKLAKNNKKKKYGLTQEYLDYNASIYRNIETKLIPFTQIFDLKNENPYILNDFETEVLRHYIGIYNEGKKQTKTEISKIFNVSPKTIDRALKTIIKDFMNPSYQQQFLDERNQIIKKAITNKNNKQKILNQDINLLYITKNLEEILRQANINTIRDLINIDNEIIEQINIEHGYYSNLRIFPKSIINEIHNMGLSFKRETMLKNKNEILNKMEIPIEDLLKIQNNTVKLKTVSDILLAKQFEPEILETFSIEEMLEIDWLFSDYRLNDAYQNFMPNLIKIQTERKVVWNIRELIERDFPYLQDYEIDEMMKNATTQFSIYEKSEEEQESLKINRYM